MASRRTALLLALLLVALVYAAIGIKWKVVALIWQLHDSNVSTRFHAACALGRMGPEASAAVPALIGALKSREPLRKHHHTGGSFTPYDHATPEARKALICIGPDAVPALTRAMEDTDALTRVHAAWAVWAITKDTTGTLPVLLEAWRDRALDEQDECIRSEATDALGEMGRENPDLLFPIVRKALQEDAEMGYEVTRVLQTMGQTDERAIKYLFELLGSDNRLFSQFAGWALRELKNQALPLLIDGLTSDKANVRSSCAWTLAGMSNPWAAQALPALKKCEGDVDPEVRKWAVLRWNVSKKRADADSPLAAAFHRLS